MAHPLHAALVEVVPGVQVLCVAGPDSLTVYAGGLVAAAALGAARAAGYDAKSNPTRGDERRLGAHRVTVKRASLPPACSFTSARCVMGSCEHGEAAS